ncbi:MAG: ATPase, T2SS/T4P/T4SS family [Candidatus Micrarchaeaceae archaeon]
MMAEDTKNRGKELASYKLNAKGLIATVSIVDAGGFVPLYNVDMQGLGEATKVFIMSLRQELLGLVPVDPTRMEDKTYERELTAKYTEAANLVINKYLPGTREETKSILIAFILNMMLGLGELEIPLADENLEEIAINGAKENIWVFHHEFGWCKTNIRIRTEELIYDSADQIGRKVGRQISNLSPMMDAEMPDGSRVNATLFPVSQTGNTITIRKFAKNPWTMPLLIKNKTISPRIAAFAWLCVQNEISMLISGGTASGKTSFLNALGVFLPPNRRVISVEETRELTLPDFLQWLPMLTRQPNQEGRGAVTLYDLMINALRQRPDILLVGEIRTKSDAETLFEAIHTGHAVYGTVHADSAGDTIVRMTNPPISTPKILMTALGAIMTLFRHRRLGIRRVYEFGEVTTTGDVSVIERWDIRNDNFVTVSEIGRLANTISLYSGYTAEEMNQDIEGKSKILEWMVKNDIISVDDAGYVVASYYKDPAKVLKAVDDDAKFSKGIF